MKAIVLGAGGMGGYAARTAAGFPYVEDLLVADRDGQAAQRLAGELGPKAHWISIDVMDEPRLVQILSEADVVLNTVGPFFRFGPPVLRAAIAARCHYLDINDDWESTEAMLAMSDRVRAAGITALIGMGASPGISNLLALRAARELDVVWELYAGFDADSAMPEATGTQAAAATIHALHQLTGRIRLFEGGKLQDKKPLERILLDYPGLGEFHAFSMGHPEAITFPQYFPDLQRSLTVMRMKPVNVFMTRLMTTAIDVGLLSIDRAARWLESLEGVGKAPKAPDDHVNEIAREGASLVPPLFAVVAGEKEGRKASVAAAILSAPPVGMGGATGVPLALGLDVLRPEGECKRGVFAPEALIDPDTFFDRLAPLCSPVKKNHRDLLLVSRSWEKRDLRSELRQL